MDHDKRVFLFVFETGPYYVVLTGLASNSQEFLLCLLSVKLKDMATRTGNENQFVVAFASSSLAQDQDGMKSFLFLAESHLSFFSYALGHNLRDSEQCLFCGLK